MWSTVKERIVNAFTKSVGWKGFGILIGCLTFCGVTCLPIGILSGFLQPSEHNGKKIAATSIRTFFFPSLIEELFWRVILLPPNCSWWTLIGWNCAYVLFHIPFSYAMSPFVPGAPNTFLDKRFLSIAFCLGLASSAAMRWTGHVIFPTVVHWIPVVVWLMKFGGEEKLRLVNS